MRFSAPAGLRRKLGRPGRAAGSRSRAGALRRVAALAGAVLAVLALGAVAAAAAAAGPEPAALTTTVVHAVTVYRGSVARVTYRADDASGGAVSVDLVVQTASGDVVRTLVHGLQAKAGVDLVWRGRVWLRPGSYVLVAHALDAGGRPESQATPAALKVLVPLPPLIPSPAARRVAFAWAARRAGRVAVAVVDSRGRLYGYREHAPFMSASVVKAMLLVAYLRDHSRVSSPMRAVLTRMIDYSDNAAADVVYGAVGRSGLTRLAHTTGMKGFRATGAWITTRITAADLARFFRDMETWVPRRHRHFANHLLARVTPSQRWGIPPAAEARGYHVYFKPGWLGAWVLANEAARLEGHSVRLGLAVFTDGNPTSSYGKETIQGVTARLLRR